MLSGTAQAPGAFQQSQPAHTGLERPRKSILHDHLAQELNSIFPATTLCLQTNQSALSRHSLGRPCQGPILLLVTGEREQDPTWQAQKSSHQTPVSWPVNLPSCLQAWPRQNNEIEANTEQNPLPTSPCPCSHTLPVHPTPPAMLWTGKEFPPRPPSLWPCQKNSKEEIYKPKNKIFQSKSDHNKWYFTV